MTDTLERLGALLDAAQTDNLRADLVRPNTGPGRVIGDKAREAFRAIAERHADSGLTPDAAERVQPLVITSNAEAEAMFGIDERQERITASREQVFKRAEERAAEILKYVEHDPNPHTDSLSDNPPGFTTIQKQVAVQHRNASDRDWHAMPRPSSSVELEGHPVKCADFMFQGAPCSRLDACPAPTVVGLDTPGPVTTLTGVERDAYLELRAATAAMTEWQAAGPVLRERMSAAIAALAKVG